MTDNIHEVARRTVACKNCGTVWGFTVPDKFLLRGLSGVAAFFRYKRCAECNASAWLDIPPGVFVWRKGKIGEM